MALAIQWLSQICLILKEVVTQAMGLVLAAWTATHLFERRPRWGEDGGRHFMAMQFIPGCSLEEQLMRGRLHWRVALHVGLQIAAALGHLAAHDITHRDVKPSNLMVAFPGENESLGVSSSTLILVHADHG